MTDNPYAPPKTALQDVAGEAPVVRPRVVTRAVWLLWALWCIDLLDTGIQWGSLVVARGVASVPWVQGLVFVLSGVVYMQLLKGRPWARIVQAMITLSGVFALSIIAAGRIAFVVPIEKSGLVEAVFVNAGNAYATWLLFTSPGKEWFRRPAAMASARNGLQ